MTSTEKKFPEGSLSFTQMIEELHRVFAEEKVNVDEVWSILEAYKSNREDWKKYAVYDQHRYTRNLVDEGNGRFNLMILCWGEGMGSSIHDHADAHCFVKMLDGELMETMFEWPSEGGKGEDTAEGPMMEKGRKTCKTNNVTYINDSYGLHRMENPSHTEGAVSLHLYSPPYSKCLAFDERTGHRHPVKVTFWSKFGERTKCGTYSAPTPITEANRPADVTPSQESLI
jgi:cysteine dioxygenase